jgi:hypothetical protein
MVIDGKQIILAWQAAVKTGCIAGFVDYSPGRAVTQGKKDCR